MRPSTMDGRCGPFRAICLGWGVVPGRRFALPWAATFKPVRLSVLLPRLGLQRISPRMGQQHFSPGQSAATERREAPPWVPAKRPVVALKGQNKLRPSTMD